MEDVISGASDKDIDAAAVSVATSTLAFAIVRQLEKAKILTTEQVEEMYLDATSALTETAMSPELDRASQIVATRAAGILRRHRDP